MNWGWHTVMQASYLFHGNGTSFPSVYVKLYCEKTWRAICEVAVTYWSW